MSDQTVLATIMDESFVRITPPVEGEPNSITGLKMFIMACFARRNMDPEFDQNMQEWLSSLKQSDFEGNTSMMKRH